MANDSLKIYAQRLTALIIEQLRSTGHVKTGALNASLKVIVNSETDVKISANDYFKSLDDKYGILNSVYKSSDYKTIMDELKTNIAKQLIKELKNGNK